MLPPQTFLLQHTQLSVQLGSGRDAVVHLLFSYADRQAIFSIFKVLEEEFGFSKQQLGLIGSAFAIVYALSAPPS
jgi:hypothetical protein